MPHKTNTLRKHLEPITIFLLFGILVLLVLFRYNPGYLLIPNRDSGVFSYIGQMILDGNLPYRDLWDHKGPAIYYINALGFYLGQGSRWGVWGIQFFSLFSAALVGYSVMKTAYGKIPSIFSSILWMLTAFYVIRYGGNFTEEYSVLLSFVSLYLFWLSRKSDSSIYFFLIGAIFSLSFLFRPNNTVIEVSIAIFVIITGLAKLRYKEIIINLSMMAVGALAILIPVILYFYMNRAIDDFIDQVFIYNIIYSASTLTDKISSIKIGFSITLSTTISAIVLISWIVGFVKLCSGRFSIQNQKDSLIILSLIALPITLLLTTMSGRSYYHYYISWLPAFALLSSYAAYELLNFAPQMVFSLAKVRLSLGDLILAVVLVFALWGVTKNTYKDIGRINTYRSSALLTIDNIQKHVKDEQYLLMWGSEAGFNIITEKPTPSRYFYHNALITCDYVTDDMIEEFVNDLKVNKPLIVDASSTSSHVPPIDSTERSNHEYIGFTANDKCNLESKMDKISSFIHANYQIADTIDYSNRAKWDVYKYNK